MSEKKPKPKTCTLTYYTGYETLDSSTTRVQAYVIEKGRGAVALSGVTNTPFKQHTSATFAAIANRKTAIHGEWRVCSTSVPEGAVVAFVVSQSRPHGDREAVFFLRTRAGAAYNNIAVPLLKLENGRTEASFEGRFDLIDLDEAEAITGVPGILKLKWQKRREGYGRVEELDPETEKRKVLTVKTVTVDGEARKIRTTRKNRKLHMS